LFEELAEKIKHQQNGMSYKDWLKISLAREKHDKKKLKVCEEHEKLKHQEEEEQKSYEKQARKYMERQSRMERLSKLSAKRRFDQSEERQMVQSPLLLAYSPNKFNKIQDQSFSKNSKYSEDY
jgi:hypothetical protein